VLCSDIDDITLSKTYALRTGHKDARSQGRGICPVRTFYRQRGIGLDVNTCIFGAEILDFSKFMVCTHWQERVGLSQCGYFLDKGEGLIFRDIVRTSFMNSLI